MRKTTKQAKQPAAKVVKAYSVTPLKSRYSDDSVGVSVSVRVSGADSSVERLALAAAYEAAAKIVMLDTPAAAPRVYHEDSYRCNGTDHVSVSCVEVEVMAGTNIDRFVAAVKEAVKEVLNAS